MSGASVEFRWMSPLGVSVALLLVCAAVYVLIGVGGAAVYLRFGAPGPANQYFLGAAADARVFDRAPSQVVREHPLFGVELAALMHALTGMMVAFGIALGSIVWFGLRRGEAWALWTAAGANGAMLISYWFFAILPAMKAFQVSYGQVFHPYAAVPTVLVPIATALGAWALASTG